MNKNKVIKIVSVLLTITFFTSAFANVTDMGYNGGISSGSRLPKTTELLLKSSSRTQREEFTYKEMLFVSGRPVEFSGLQTVTKGIVDTSVEAGSYQESYVVRPSASSQSDVTLSRNLRLNTNYRNIAGTTQTIIDSEVAAWTESISADGVSLTLDRNLSYFSKSIIMDRKPGVTYYKGNISSRAVYGMDEDRVTVETTGSIYGYDSAWSTVETMRLDVYVYNESGERWQFQAQVRPSFSSGKSLQFSRNEPTAISFDGNYYEVIRSQSGLTYTIYAMPTRFLDTTPMTGSINIPSVSSFEQLPAPNLDKLRGHFAQDDIRRLFATQVFDGDPDYFVPSQGMTRGQFIAALVKAVKLPIEKVPTRGTASNPINIVFGDVRENRADYPYIMAAYEAGIVSGKSDGKFYPDDVLTRQEAVAMMLRTLGLSNLGFENESMTSFVDDSSIAGWAKKEVSAASKLGIIKPDGEGRFSPKSLITKAEGAAFLNAFMNYLRVDLPRDYTERIVNFDY